MHKFFLKVWQIIGAIGAVLWIIALLSKPQITNDLIISGVVWIIAAVMYGNESRNTD